MGQQRATPCPHTLTRAHCTSAPSGLARPPFANHTKEGPRGSAFQSLQAPARLPAGETRNNRRIVWLTSTARKHSPPFTGEKLREVAIEVAMEHFISGEKLGKVKIQAYLPLVESANSARSRHVSPAPNTLHYICIAA